MGKTIIIVDKPYQIHEYGRPSNGLGAIISDDKLNDVIEQYFYDDSASRKGHSGYQFAINALESVEENVIDKWADFSEMFNYMMEDYLLKVANPLNMYSLDDFFHKIPIDQSPIISLSNDSLKNALYLKLDNVKSFSFPDEGKGLFTEMAKIGLLDQKSLIRFVNNFGLPSGIDVLKREGLNELDDLDGIKAYNTLLFFGAAPVTLIGMELTEYKNIFNSFIAVKTKDAKLAKKINARKRFINDARKINELERDREELIEPLRNKYQNTLRDIEYSNNIDEEEELKSCRKELAVILNKKVAFNSKIIDTLDGHFIETKIYNNLFEIAYNQIKDSLINESEIKECDYCGHYFEPEHGKQRFCSPLPFRKRSSCENSYNQDRYKKRKQQKKDRG